MSGAANFELTAEDYVGAQRGHGKRLSAWLALLFFVCAILFALVDRRIGVSPWHWWADVPIRRRDSVYVNGGRYVQGPPKVKYRGIFINDEEPALGGEQPVEVRGGQAIVATSVG